MDRPYEVATIDDLDKVPVLQGALTWRPVRRRFGIEAFGVNVFSAERAGELVIEDHYEREGPEELYVVLRGRAAFTLGDGCPGEGSPSRCGPRASSSSPSPWTPTRTASRFDRPTSAGGIPPYRGNIHVGN